MKVEVEFFCSKGALVTHECDYTYPHPALGRSERYYSVKLVEGDVVIKQDFVPACNIADFVLKEI